MNFQMNENLVIIELKISVGRFRMARKKKWIQKAIKRPGVLRAIAKRAGALNPDGTIKISWLRQKAKQGNSRIAREARLALTLRKLRKKRKKKK